MAEERQISEYGEFLKHLRIDKREMLKNMADKLGIKFFISFCHRKRKPRDSADLNGTYLLKIQLER